MSASEQKTDLPRWNGPKNGLNLQRTPKQWPIWELPKIRRPMIDQVVGLSLQERQHKGPPNSENIPIIHGLGPLLWGLRKPGNIKRQGSTYCNHRFLALDTLQNLFGRHPYKLEERPARKAAQTAQISHIIQALRRGVLKQQPTILISKFVHG